MANFPNCKSGQYRDNELPCQRSALCECSCFCYDFVDIIGSHK